MLDSNNHDDARAAADYWKKRDMALHFMSGGVWVVDGVVHEGGPGLQRLASLGLLSSLAMSKSGTNWNTCMIDARQEIKNESCAVPKLKRRCVC
jgi:hypothetical protein